jgi:signal transduction histidine kinase
MSAQTIPFSNGSAQIYMEFFFEYKYYYFVTILCVALSFLFFIIIMLFLINKKTTYIGLLEKEIKILEGGDLGYPITIKGKDELASLAHSINEMRLSFIEWLQNEDNARTANSELLTAMSHDLRTPLTTLIGYPKLLNTFLYLI